MFLKEDIIKFEQYIQKGHRIVVIGHINPDGDSVGSASAMHHYLLSLKKNSKVLFPSSYPSFLSFLDKTGDYLIYPFNLNSIKRHLSLCDTIICIDFNNLSRSEGLQRYIESSKAVKILIDHHLSPDTDSFDLVFSAPELSSACEVLFWVFMQCESIEQDASKLPFNTLEALATGLLTDTNNFNNSVLPSTFKMASALLDCGVNLDVINKRVFGCYSQERMRLMGEMLRNGMHIIPDLGAAYMVLTNEIKREYEYQNGDSEGFVNLPLKIEGISVSAFFTESDDYVKVSLRSDGKYSVNELSNLFFNGGGHERAAGGRLYMSINEVPAYFENSLRTFVQNKVQNLKEEPRGK